MSVELVPVNTWVYNFTVAEAHTYFVGDGQWLVHNKCSATGIGDFLGDLSGRKGSFFADTVDTTFGRFEVGGVANVKGAQLYITDAMIFPEGEAVNPIGTKAVMQLLEELGTEARRQGFDSLRVIGKRVTGANPGHPFDIILDLTKPRFN